MNEKYLWIAAYICGVGLAALTLSPAPVVLAVGLPLGLMRSRQLRESRLFALWILLSVAGGLTFWRLSQGASQRDIDANALLTAIVAVPFAQRLRMHRPGAIPLAFLALYTVLVGYFSSGHGGSDLMLGWLAERGLSDRLAHAVVLAFRKTVHFTFYGTVGLTALLAARPFEANRLAAASAGVSTALALACFDELRQSGFANRTGSAWDVLLDVAGAAAFVGLLQWSSTRAR